MSENHFWSHLSPFYSRSSMAVSNMNSIRSLVSQLRETQALAQLRYYSNKSICFLTSKALPCQQCDTTPFILWFHCQPMVNPHDRSWWCTVVYDPLMALFISPKFEISGILWFWFGRRLRRVRIHWFIWVMTQLCRGDHWQKFTELDRKILCRFGVSQSSPW